MPRSGVAMANISGLFSAAGFRAASALVAVLVGAGGVFTANGPRFYPDDPLSVDDDRALDASRVVAVEDANSYDFVVNTFKSPGERRDVRALNVNTLDEVPDSSWFTNRIGRVRLPTAELVRGPDRFNSISLEGWVVSSGKSTGVQPGFRMTDPQGHLHQIEFDPPSNPELATGAEIIGTAFYYAFGYNTVDVYLAELDADRLVISPNATQFDPLLGERRTADPARHRQRAAPGGKATERKVSRAREPVCRRQAPGQLPLLQHPARRSQRRRAARASPRAASRPRVRGLAESRRLTRSQQPRHARRGTGAPLHQALHVRLRFNHGQRHGLRTASPARATSTSSNGNRAG